MTVLKFGSIVQTMKQRSYSFATTVQLDRVIRNVRREGYSADLEALNEGIHYVGAPIRDVTKKVIAAISISAPAIRLTKQKVKK
jgi:IclR family acetate operon transcriptional repressor